MLTKKGMYKRFCRRCGKIFETKHRYSKVCKGCYLPMGWEVRKKQYEEARKNAGSNSNT